MIHTKVFTLYNQSNQEEMIHTKVFTLYNQSDLLGCDVDQIYKLLSPFAWRLHIIFLIETCPFISEEKWMMADGHGR